MPEQRERLYNRRGLMAVDYERIMILTQRRCKYMEEILSLTEDLARQLDREDEVSCQLFLKMRAEEMEKSDQAGYETMEAQRLATPQERAHIRLLFSGRAEEAHSFEERKIAELSAKLEETRLKAVEVDKRLNKRTAKERSFYKD